MGEWVLEASGLRRRYGNVGVLEASIRIQSRESVAVLGRSGSGKSTLVAMLAVGRYSVYSGRAPNAPPPECALRHVAMRGPPPLALCHGGEFSELTLSCGIVP